MDQRARGLNVRVSITASLMNISVPDWYSRRGFKNLGCDGSQGPQADGDVRCWWFLFIKPRIQLKRAIQWVVWCYWMGVYSLRSWMGLDPSEVWNHSCLRSFIPRLDDFSKPYRLNTSHFLAHKNGLMIMYTQFQATLKEIHFVTLDNSSLRAPVSSSIIWFTDRIKDDKYVPGVLLFCIHTSRTDVLNWSLHALRLNPNMASDSFSTLLHTFTDRENRCVFLDFWCYFWF